MANEEKNEPIIAVAEVSGEELLDDAMDTVVTEEYGADQIQVLEGLEAVRKRPGMYIGSTGPRGLHHLVYEIVDNSIDEALAGFCTHIEVEILPGNIISVRDNGRGIPVAMHEKMGIPTLTVVLTVLHAGGSSAAVATRFPAVCMASVHRLLTLFPSGWRPRFPVTDMFTIRSFHAATPFAI